MLSIFLILDGGGGFRKEKLDRKCHFRPFVSRAHVSTGLITIATDLDPSASTCPPVPGSALRLMSLTRSAETAVVMSAYGPLTRAPQSSSMAVGNHGGVRKSQQTRGGQPASQRGPAPGDAGEVAHKPMAGGRPTQSS